jgi:hypothetical protein
MVSLPQAPHGKPHEVLLEFQDNVSPTQVSLSQWSRILTLQQGGWDNTGLSSIVGLITVMGLLIGYDCAVHMGKSRCPRPKIKRPGPDNV